MIFGTFILNKSITIKFRGIVALMREAGIREIAIGAEK